MMKENPTEKITSEIIALQDKNGCWNVLSAGDKYYPDLKHYSPIYNSTLWVLVLLADIQCDPDNPALLKPLKIITEHFYDRKNGIFTIGKSHFPIPCLNGNMLYLLNYFNADNQGLSDSTIDFFSVYQRFDDGDFKTPAKFPYYRNKSCYGNHSCYWGITKLLKGISFIPKIRRSENAKKLLKNCLDFILLHDVCYGSRNKNAYLHPNIARLTFPNMYQSDFLEILWLLKREKVISPRMKKALRLLKSKMNPDSGWSLEREIRNLIFPLNKKNYGNIYLTQRAKEVSDFYLKYESVI